MRTVVDYQHVHNYSAFHLFKHHIFQYKKINELNIFTYSESEYLSFLNNFRLVQRKTNNNFH